MFDAAEAVSHPSDLELLHFLARENLDWVPDIWQHRDSGGRNLDGWVQYICESVNRANRTRNPD